MPPRKAGAGSMATTSCPSSFKVSDSPTGSRSPPTRRPPNPKPPSPEPSGHLQNSAIARSHRALSRVNAQESWARSASPAADLGAKNTLSPAQPTSENRALIERIRPLIAEQAAAAEANRQLSGVVYQAMEDAGLFRMLAPKAHGGLELHPADCIRA